MADALHNRRDLQVRILLTTCQQASSFLSGGLDGEIPCGPLSGTSFFFDWARKTLTGAACGGIMRTCVGLGVEPSGAPVKDITQWYG